MPVWKDNITNKNITEDKLIDTLRELFDSQSRQLTQLSVQVNTLLAAQESMRSDFNQKWNELPTIYLSRREDQARGLEGRITALEEYRLASTQTISEVKLSVQQQVQTEVQKIRDEVSEQRAGFDARAISAWVTGFFLLANIVWSVVAHFILK